MIVVREVDGGMSLKIFYLEQKFINKNLFSNCTSLQWWNGTYCRNKGTPAWGTNSSARCNASYQCADYNLVSCPLGAIYPATATCECATTKYWVCQRKIPLYSIQRL